MRSLVRYLDVEKMNVTREEATKLIKDHYLRVALARPKGHYPGPLMAALLETNGKTDDLVARVMANPEKWTGILAGVHKSFDFLSAQGSSKSFTPPTEQELLDMFGKDYVDAVMSGFNTHDDIPPAPQPESYSNQDPEQPVHASYEGTSVEPEQHAQHPSHGSHKEHHHAAQHKEREQAHHKGAANKSYLRPLYIAAGIVSAIAATGYFGYSYYGKYNASVQEQTTPSAPISQAPKPVEQPVPPEPKKTEAPKPVNDPKPKKVESPEQAAKPKKVETSKPKKAKPKKPSLEFVIGSAIIESNGRVHWIKEKNGFRKYTGCVKGPVLTADEEGIAKMIKKVREQGATYRPHGLVAGDPCYKPRVGKDGFTDDWAL